jgi:signal transduction histidine kinase
MRILQSLRFRLMAAAAIWIVLALTAGYFAFSSIFRSQVNGEFHDELHIHVQEVERITRFNRQGAAIERLPFSDPRYEAPGSGFYWEVASDDRVLFSSGSLQGRAIGSLPQDRAHSMTPVISHVEGPSGPMLVIAKFGPESEGGYRFALGTDQRHIDAAIREFDGALVTALASLGGILLATVLGLISFGLAPFHKLARAMRDVRSGATLSVEGAHPTEVQPLVTELNTLIKGQRDALQRARAQAGNLAHALKTPLAIISDEAFQLAERGDKDAAKVIAEHSKAMQLHIDHHIARARAQAVSRLPGTRSDVADNIASIMRALGRLHVQRGVNVTQNLATQLKVAMDGQDFAELVANLVDNAYKFARSRIIVTAQPVDDAFLRVTVEDDGPGLAPQAREIVFAPGIRLDETRPGTGLGLSIVRDLLELYQGEIELGVSSIGGLSATMKLRRHI